jgi:hypothetical protein
MITAASIPLQEEYILESKAFSEKKNHSISKSLAMGPCHSKTDHDDPREPPQRPGGNTTIDDAEHERRANKVNRTAAGSAGWGWVCTCEHFNTGKHTDSSKCSTCHRAGSLSWLVRTSTVPGAAQHIKNGTSQNDRGWYHTTCLKHHRNRNLLIVCTTPKCALGAEEIVYTCKVTK